MCIQSVFSLPEQLVSVSSQLTIWLNDVASAVADAERDGAIVEKLGGDIEGDLAAASDEAALACKGVALVLQQLMRKVHHAVPYSLYTWWPGISIMRAP